MKNNHNRLKYLLVATMITGMVAMLIWTFSSVSLTADNGGLKQLQAENDQLRQMIAEMQLRENTFRTQIQKANETIFQLIDSPEPSAPTLSSLEQTNKALQERVTTLEQQLQQQSAPDQSSFSSRSQSEENEEQEHEGS